MMRRALLVLAVTCVGACGTPALEDAGIDAGAPDASTPDASTPDAGTPDAGTPDAGPVPSVSIPDQPCTDTLAAVIAATPGAVPLGARRACHFERSLAPADITTALPSAPASPSGADVFLIAYRTTRRGDVPGVSTARVWLPTSAKTGPLPVIAIAHGSEGLADTCAPSRNPNGLVDLVLPWVSRGYAVIAPDFAGLGNAGVQGYVDNHDTAYSMLDAVRALRALVPARAIDERAILIGYSQGGGAVLASQGLERTYGSGGTLSAIVAVAPQYFTRLDSFGYVTMLRSPDALTVAQGYTKPVVAALRQYAWFENTLGPGRGVDAFPAVSAAGTVAALETRCLIDLGAWLPSQRQRVRELIDDTLRTTFLACVDGAGCVNPGKQLYDGLSSDLVAGDPLGAPVLYLQGGLDTVMPVGEEAACNVPYLRAGLVPLTYCTDNLAAHHNVLSRNVELVRTWGEAVMLGTAPPACSGVGPPACQ